eukprot:TRINITY_DN9893_c0_g1_i10.p1 TRINITY_DN9893_c0_g1~~TRINITY_DN9893_c0_g1_i10.p1  ORF type:complete len:136 (-),score=43.89 TRINITY_DN9893_c0_g1_i10:192-599(-)
MEKVLNEMRGLGDVEEELKPKSVDEKVEEDSSGHGEVNEEREFSDSEYHITTSVVTLASSHDDEEKCDKPSRVLSETNDKGNTNNEQSQIKLPENFNPKMDYTKLLNVKTSHLGIKKQKRNTHGKNKKPPKKRKK